MVTNHLVYLTKSEMKNSRIPLSTSFDFHESFLLVVFGNISLVVIVGRESLGSLVFGVGWLGDGFGYCGYKYFGVVI